MLHDIFGTLEGSELAPGWRNPGLTDAEMETTLQIPTTHNYQEKVQDSQA